MMLCCIGDLVEDVVVWPTARTQRGTDTASKVFRSRGGSAANVAMQAALLAGRSRFIGQVGDDHVGRRLADELAQCGVDTQIEFRGRTGTIVVLIEPDGERTMFPDRAAATQLDRVGDHALDQITWLHVPGYSLMVEPLGATARHLIAEARTAGISVSIDASSTGLITSFGVTRFTQQLGALQPDLLFANRDEAELLGIDDEHPFAGSALTVVKAGPDPVLLIEPSGSTTEIAVPAVSGVADTTGAGDAFAAGFLVATIDGAPAVDAAARGVALAATVLLRPGAGGNDQ